MSKSSVVGGVVLLLMTVLGASPAAAVCPSPNANPNANLRVQHDFDADCKSEIVWRYTDGSNWLWTLNGLSHAGSTQLAAASYPWSIVGTGDFDGDGRADILWRAPDGRLAVWFRGDIAQSAYLVGNVPFSWNVAGIGDFNNDGSSDILWRAADGTVAIWFMNGASHSDSIVANVASNWFIAGVGDFNGDGTSDILWRADDSTAAVWLMSNTATIASSAVLGSVPLSWSAALIGDFDGNGRADILWRDSDGTNAIWLMNAGGKTFTSSTLNKIGKTWTIGASGDFNGDGKTDIVWRDAGDGSVAIWLMNGAAIGSSGYTTAVADFGWTTVPPVPVPSGSTAACAHPTPPGAIVPLVVASRVSGVAPLAVFFDATGTTATATTRPFHDLDYRWNFGDSGAGNWTATPGMPNLNRNEATGAVAAHVFEKPGTYNICLLASDGPNTAVSLTQVTVTDPDEVFKSNTRCFSTSGNFSGCPAGADTEVTSSFATVISRASTKKRLLLRRGEVWNATFDVLSAAGPGIIGAFGSGAKPILRASGGDTVVLPLSAFNNATPTFADWRVMDVDIDGNNTAGTRGIELEGAVKQMTFLRVDIRRNSSGVLAYFGESEPINVATYPWKEFAFADCTVTNNNDYGMFMFIYQLAVMGTVLDTVTVQHVTRFPYIRKSILSHNLFKGGAGSKHLLKLVSMNFPATSVFNEQIVITDNKFEGGLPGYSIDFGPQNAVSDERLRHVVFERNWSIGGALTDRQMGIFASDVTVRNNLFDLSNSNTKTAVEVIRRGVEPAPERVNIYNNTIFSSDTGGGFLGLTFDGATVLSGSARNNLAYAPNHTSPVVVSAGAAVTQSNNSTNAQAKSTSPLFVSGAPSAPADFKLNAGSYAINSGAALPVFSDFFRLPRPNGAADLGMWEKP